MVFVMLLILLEFKYNVLEMMMAGASAVEIGSAVYDNFNVFSDIEAELYAEDGIPAEEIVGCAHD